MASAPEENEKEGVIERPTGSAAAGKAETLAVDDRGFPVLGKEFGDVVVECDGVSKSYTLEGGEKVPALHSIDLTLSSPYYPIRKGEFVMIRGPSGGGKTTLLNMLGTIDKPTSGIVKLFGTTLDYEGPSSDEDLSRLRLERCGFVFQSFNLLGTLTAFENVELPMSLLNILSSKERAKKTRQLLCDVGLEDRMTHLPSELSGGEQQRVTIARALANDPELLLADEPTGDLDTRTTVEVMNLLLKFNKEKKLTILMVTHNAELECYADRILYVRDGRLAAQAINAIQAPLRADQYAAYLHSTTTSD